jgi:hypothetical protein
MTVDCTLVVINLARFNFSNVYLIYVCDQTTVSEANTDISRLIVYVAAERESSNIE